MQTSLSFVVLIAFLVVLAYVVVVVAPDGSFSFSFSFLLWLLWVVVAAVVVAVVVVVVVAFAFSFLPFPFLFASASFLSSDVVDVLVNVADCLTWEVRVGFGEEVVDHLLYLRATYDAVGGVVNTRSQRTPGSKC